MQSYEGVPNYFNPNNALTIVIFGNFLIIKKTQPFVNIIEYHHDKIN